MWLRLLITARCRCPYKPINLHAAAAAYTLLLYFNDSGLITFEPCTIAGRQWVGCFYLQWEDRLVQLSGSVYNMWVCVCVWFLPLCVCMYVHSFSESAPHWPPEMGLENTHFSVKKMLSQCSSHWIAHSAVQKLEHAACKKWSFQLKLLALFVDLWLQIEKNRSPWVLNSHCFSWLVAWIQNKFEIQLMPFARIKISAYSNLFLY